MRNRSNHRRRASGLFTLLILASLASPAFADRDSPGVTLFRDVHFKGSHQTFHRDIPDLRDTSFGNDAVSSLTLDHGCRATLFADAHFRGRSVALRGDVADLRRTNVGNDRVSSLRVDCPGFGHRRHDDGGRGRGATVYADAGFRGRAERIVANDPDLRDNPIRQDTISSVVVDPGCRVVLYSDTGYRGAAAVVRNKHHDLRYSPVGNDRVSSIRVECGR